MEKRTINPENWVSDEITFKVYKSGRVDVYGDRFQMFLGEERVLDEEQGWTVQEFNFMTNEVGQEPRILVRGCKYDWMDGFMAYPADGNPDELTRDDADPINAAVKVLAMIY